MNETQRPSPAPEDDRLDRLADRALFDPGEPVMATDDLAEATELELAASAAYLAMAPPAHAGGPLPEAVRARVMADARRYFAGVPTRPRIAAPGRGRAASLIASAGWVAAAASLFLAFWAWKPAPIALPMTPSEQMQELSRAYRPIRLSATDHPLARGAGGELIWSGDRQSGFLKLQGLAEVDPKKGAYQLWIFDRDRDARYPVDGGLFGVDDATRPTIIPIRASVPVREPTLFAITLEPPGGVVVSDRKRIMLTGTLPPTAEKPPEDRPAPSVAP